ncbi:MAG: EAL domain-containing protein [Bryobacteraceae bacterium]|jgi:diguanylate cyclase (GGDEF)-like protein/PAS domain S-box-containing protein
MRISTQHTPRVRTRPIASRGRNGSSANGKASSLSVEAGLLIAALQSLPIAVATADGRGIVRSVNAAFTSLTRYTAEEAVGQPITLVSCGVAQQGFYEVLQEAFRSGDPWRGEWVCRRKTGDRFTAEQIVTAIKSPSGKILRVVVTIQDITARNQAAEELQLARECLQVIEHAAEAGTWSWNCITCRIGGSCEWLKLHGIGRERTALTWEAFAATLHSEDRARIASLFEKSLKERAPHVSTEYRILLPDGRLRWIGASGGATYDAFGLPLRMAGVCFDLTERKRAAVLAAEAHRDFERFFNLIPDLACIVSTDGYFKKVNPAWEVKLGFTMEEVLKTPMLDFIHPEDVERTLSEVAKQSPQHRTAQFVNRYRCKNGSYRILNWTTTFNRDDSTRFGVATDITDQRLAESAAQAMGLQLAHSAQYDFLTGLPNRMLLNDRVAKAIDLAQRQSKKVSLLFLDLDGFKYINDSLGHPIGDKLLQSIAKRLEECVRASDTVSRQGGDEFVVLLSEVAHAEDAAISARRIVKAVAEAHSIDGHDLHVTTSIGLSIYPDDGLDAETLIKNADTAMYQSKENGRQGYQFFKPAMNARAVERQSIEEGLRCALKRRELTLHYQPKINLRTKEITGAEALLRWTHPTRGLIPPAQFIPIAEDCGLILAIGNWVLREACKQARTWVDAHLPKVTMAVNISAMEFHNENFLEGVFAILADTGLDPRFLELELTESVLMKHSESAASILKSLRARGVRVAIDDFGTGYSSLSYLRKFPVDALKIDPSFVHRIAAAPDETTILAAVISLARSLKLRVVAEGVETKEELAFLQTHRCDEAQGYYFSVPLPPQQFARLLRTGILVGEEPAPAG